MLERALTTRCCGDIVRMLTKERGWTIARIARTIGASADYVRRVAARKQSFQMADVEALAKALKQPAFKLIFDSIQRDKQTPEMKALYDLTQREIDRHDEFARALRRKPTKKRRVGTKAA